MLQYNFNDEIVGEYLDGYTKQEIADFNDCSLEKVRKVLRENGIYTYMRKEQQQQIIEMHNQGMYDIDIAKALNCTRANITHFLNKQGYTDRKSKIDDINLRNRISETLKNRYTYTDNLNFTGSSDLYDVARGIFKTIRNSVMRNRPNVCTVCGATNVPLEVHHIKSFNTIFNEFMETTYSGNRATFNTELWNYPDFIDESNIIIVCKDCHDKIHMIDYPELNQYIRD